MRPPIHWPVPPPRRVLDVATGEIVPKCRLCPSPSEPGLCGHCVYCWATHLSETTKRDLRRAEREAAGLPAAGNVCPRCESPRVRTFCGHCGYRYRKLGRVGLFLTGLGAAMAWLFGSSTATPAGRRWPRDDVAIDGPMPDPPSDDYTGGVGPPDVPLNAITHPCDGCGKPIASPRIVCDSCFRSISTSASVNTSIQMEKLRRTIAASWSGTSTSAGPR